LRRSFSADIVLFIGFIIAIILTISHPIIAAMLTHVSNLLSGDVAPFWPHVFLLSVSIAASIAVGAGIIFEGEKYSPSTRNIAFWLVVSGVAMEAVSTIFLFAFDEGISSSQQAKIIQLETQLSPRSLDKDQFDAIQSVKGEVTAVYIMPAEGAEPTMFAMDISFAVNIGFPAAEFESGDIKNNPLYKAFARAELLAGAENLGNFFPFENIPRDRPIVFRGEKFPRVLDAKKQYFPESKPK
jgi:hypothetical protein